MRSRRSRTAGCPRSWAGLGSGCSSSIGIVCPPASSASLLAAGSPRRRRRGPPTTRRSGRPAAGDRRVARPPRRPPPAGSRALAWSPGSASRSWKWRTRHTGWQTLAVPRPACLEWLPRFGHPFGARGLGRTHATRTSQVRRRRSSRRHRPRRPGTRSRRRTGSCPAGPAGQLQRQDPHQQGVRRRGHLRRPGGIADRHRGAPQGRQRGRRRGRDGCRPRCHRALQLGHRWRRLLRPLQRPHRQGRHARRPRDRTQEHAEGRVHRPDDRQALPADPREPRAGHQRRLRRHARHARHLGEGPEAGGAPRASARRCARRPSSPSAASWSTPPSTSRPRTTSCGSPSSPRPAGCSCRAASRPRLARSSATPTSPPPTG